VTVALGTDSVASNNRMDLLEEARFAQLLMRSRHASATLLPAEQLLRLVTLDGARALGLDDRIGALEPGRDADLCAVRLDRPHTRPVHDPLAALFHAARASDCVLAVVRGRIVQQGGRPITLDVDRAREDIDEVAARLRRTMRAHANAAVPADRRPA
jgi:5-methylthioadenosine/S-adenosylhomocysteine deaminase